MLDQLFVQIDSDEKKRKFKSKTVEKEHTIKQVINKAIDNYLDENGKPSWMNTEKQ